MLITKRQWTAAILGIIAFLVAFGVAFASSHHPIWQVGQTKDGTSPLTPLLPLPSSSIIVSFDSTGDRQVVSLQFPTWYPKPPVPSWERSVPQVVWLHNNQAVHLRPIGPCHEAIRSGGGTTIGKIEAEMWDAAGNARGKTCQDDWPDNWVVAPGEIWRMVVRLRGVSGDVTSGDAFNVVFAAVGSIGDAPIIVPSRWKLELRPGMNFVSLPRPPYRQDINQVIPLDANIDIVCTFDTKIIVVGLGPPSPPCPPDGPGWLTAMRNPATGLFEGSLHTIDAEHAYWMRSRAFVDLRIEIPSSGIPELLPVISVKPGWALVVSPTGSDIPWW